MGPHRRPSNSEETKWASAKRVYLLFPVATMVAFAGLLYAESLTVVDVLNYILQKVHLTMLGYWFCMLAVVMPAVLTLSPRWDLDMRRKVWHFTIVAMFLPVGANIDSGFTSFAMAVALVVFLLLEIVRGIGLPPYGLALHEVLSGYVDERDTCGPIIVSHIFLLLGIWLPIVLASSPAGIVCLGLGDASASIIGRRYGRHKWFGKKTVEGTLAFAFAAGIALAIITIFIPSYGINLSWARIAAVAVTTSLLEATSGMNDNVIVPTYMLVVLRVAQMD
jgi:dolichol kinase